MIREIGMGIVVKKKYRFPPLLLYSLYELEYRIHIISACDRASTPIATAEMKQQ